MAGERNVNAIDRRLGQRVRMRRLEIGMSQEQLAEILGITFQQVQKYEKGVNRIASSRLLDISSALDMPIAQLFEGIGLGPSGSSARKEDGPVQAVLSTPEGAQLVALFASVESTKVRRRVVELVRALAEEHGEVKR